VDRGQRVTQALEGRRLACAEWGDPDADTGERLTWLTGGAG
jgi:hypothetical protein